VRRTLDLMQQQTRAGRQVFSVREVQQDQAEEYSVMHMNNAALGSLYHSVYRPFTPTRQKKNPSQQDYPLPIQ